MENILLPDATTNEPASHSFIKYQIQILNNLSKGTQIHNTADIFFGFNPPIQTNTTLNTLVSEIVTTSVIHPKIQIQISPNPFSNSTIISIGNLPNNQPTNLILRDLMGQIVQQQTVNSNINNEVGYTALPNGIYFLEMETNEISLGQ